MTAGNASGLNDGAAALLLANEEGLKSQGLEPLARIVSSAVVGVAPRIMGIGPVEASTRALAKAGLRFEDMEVIELNEAFAAQSLACIRSWGLADDDARINPNGGAIALGHPLGMTGAKFCLQPPDSFKEPAGDTVWSPSALEWVKATPRSLKTPLAERHGVCIQRHDPRGGPNGVCASPSHLDWARHHRA